MITQERVQNLPLHRFDAEWRRTSRHLPLSPSWQRPRRSLWQQFQNWLWRAAHQRLA